MKNILLALLLFWHGSATADTAYVAENVNAKLRSGKGENYRTLKVLAAKTEVEVLEPDDEFAKVKTAEGQVGWIKSSLLKPISKSPKDVAETVMVVSQQPDLSTPGAEETPATPPNIAASVPNGPDQNNKSISTLLTVALVAFLAGIAVGAFALRAYYLRRLRGLRI
jgi:hypothetical protein